MVNLEHRLTVDDLIVEYAMYKVKNGYEPKYSTSELIDFLHFFTFFAQYFIFFVHFLLIYVNNAQLLCTIYDMSHYDLF